MKCWLHIKKTNAGIISCVSKFLFNLRYNLWRWPSFIWQSSCIHMEHCVLNSLDTLAPSVRYTVIILWNPALATMCVPLCNSVTRQAIELESCSNPQKMRQVFQFAFKKLESFGFGVFVGDVISEVGFDNFGLGHQLLERIFWLKILLETKL